MGVQSLGFSFPQGPVPSQLAQTPLNHTDWHWRNKRVPSAWKKTSSASTRLRWPLHPSKPMRGAQPLPSTPKMRLQSDSIIFPTPGSAGKRKVNPNESGPAPNGLTGRMKPEASTKKGHVLMLSEWTKDMRAIMRIQQSEQKLLSGVSGQAQGMFSFFLFSEGLFSYIPLLEFGVGSFWKAEGCGLRDRKRANGTRVWKLEEDFGMVGE